MIKYMFTNFINTDTLDVLDNHEVSTEMGQWKLNYSEHLRAHAPKTWWKGLAWNNSSRVICATFLTISKLIGKFKGYVSYRIEAIHSYHSWYWLT